MKNIKNLIAILVVVFALTSCVREYKEPTAPNQSQQNVNNFQGNKKAPMSATANQRANQNANPTSTSDYTVDKKGNYYQELRKGLGLTRPQMNQVKGVMENYRKRIKSAGPTSKQGLALKGERNNKLLTVLSKAQMEQKKYIDAVYFGFKTDSPAHPVNLKNNLALTDGQILEVLAAQSDFKSVRSKLGKNVDPKAPQLMKALEKRNTALQQILSNEQFAGYRKAMKQAYSVAG